jgi:predicted protein tyrosine phosphatase
MPWIENVAATDVGQGFHHAAGTNSMLIQIADPAGWFPTPRYQFKEVHHFEFLDAEDADGFSEEAKCSDAQAAELVSLLQHALHNHMNVIVHCTAGICRSGAVCEVGVQLGFDDCERFRQPNLRVKHRMMRALGWTYDAAEQTDPDHWRNYKY